MKLSHSEVTSPDFSSMNSGYMKPYKHKTQFVTWPYYYYFHSVPYYEDTTLLDHDEIYDPYQSFKPQIILHDGTEIEGFNGPFFSQGFLTCILLLIILLFIYQMKK